MKRSRQINLDLMRKQTVRTGLKSLAVSITATTLVGCDAGEEVEIVTSVLDCVDDTPMGIGECRVAYKEALLESERVGPKYSTEKSCESEFGINQCIRNQFGSYTPIMVGYLFANSLFDRDTERYGANYNPVYRYFRPFSSLHNKLVTADGQIIGEDEGKKYKMKKKSLKRKPSMTKTVSRGGFGSVARSKTSRSSWGG